MSLTPAKFAVLHSLQVEPDFTRLSYLTELSQRRFPSFLAWLDRSGMTLYFLHAVKQHSQQSRLPESLLRELYARQQRNNIRSADMLHQFFRIHNAFAKQGIQYATLKGFSLIPDYCPSIQLRHQTDFDFLIASDSLAPSSVALQSCGYLPRNIDPVGESYFTTPLIRTPTSKDDLFEVQQHRQVDLHASLWNPIPYFSLALPADSLQRIEHKAIEGYSIPCLAQDDLFLLLVLHAFKHMLRSWIRASWLLELARCMHSRSSDHAFWQSIMERSGNSLIIKKIFSLVLSAASDLFAAPVPVPLRKWFRIGYSSPLHTWVTHFGKRWVLADWPGSLLNLFLAREFILEVSALRAYRRSRIRPSGKQFSTGHTPPATIAGRTKHFWANSAYFAERGTAHVRDLMKMPFETIQWNLALQQTRSSSVRQLEGQDA